MFSCTERPQRHEMDKIQPEIIVLNVFKFHKKTHFELIHLTLSIPSIFVKKTPVKEFIFTSLSAEKRVQILFTALAKRIL